MGWEPKEPRRSAFPPPPLAPVRGPEPMQVIARRSPEEFQARLHGWEDALRVVETCGLEVAKATLDSLKSTL
jgi:hypothetical protein